MAWLTNENSNSVFLIKENHCLLENEIKFAWRNLDRFMIFSKFVNILWSRRQLFYFWQRWYGLWINLWLIVIEMILWEVESYWWWFCQLEDRFDIDNRDWNHSLRLLNETSCHASTTWLASAPLCVGRSLSRR